MKILGVYIFITGGLYFGFDHCGVVMLPDFKKKKKKKKI